MKVFIDTSIFVDCLRTNSVTSSKTAVSYGIKKVVTRNIDHFNKIKDLKAVTPEELDF